MKAGGGVASVESGGGVASVGRTSLHPASVASVLLPDDGSTKEHVKHVPFHKHVPFQKMQAQGTSLPTSIPTSFQKMQAKGTTNSTTASDSECTSTSDLTSSAGTRQSVYDGFNEIHVKNAEKCKGHLEGAAEVVAPDYIIPGARQAKQHRLGPAYEIGLCATGVGGPQMPSYAKELVQGAGAEEVAAMHLGGGRGAGVRAGGCHALGSNGVLSRPAAVEGHARAGGFAGGSSFEAAMLKHMDPAVLAARLNVQLGSRYSVYLLYWYKSTNADAGGAQAVDGGVHRGVAGARRGRAGGATDAVC